LRTVRSFAKDDVVLMLLFYAGKQRFACDCENIVEVIPRVSLKIASHMPDYVVGLLNYGGISVPVVDFCNLIDNRPAAPVIHTRIILFEYLNATGRSHLFGLVGEKVTQTIIQQPTEFIDVELKMKDLPFLGGSITDDEGTIQLLMIDRLFQYLQAGMESNSLKKTDSNENMP
jgi:chemotaxis-related protein WspB